MIKYMLLALFVFSCSNKPPCKPITDKDWSPGIFSRKLGYVRIDGELCQIFEQYNKTDCHLSFSNDCSGDTVECCEHTLTRTTKCPSITSQNTINYSQNKFHTETVE